MAESAVNKNVERVRKSGFLEQDIKSGKRGRNVPAGKGIKWEKL